ncbi:MAG: hypothetical protein GF307_01070 [candidate division Zixibacteria bacterium]|nr:hypothetical protein [candidate division Zixibacteria bacterium]
MFLDSFTKIEIRELITSHIYSTAFENDLDKPVSCFKGLAGEFPEDGLFPIHINPSNINNIREGDMDKLSNDPYIPVNKAREICEKTELAVDF